MLILNLKRIMQTRGVDNHYRFLRTNDFTHSSAYNLLNGAAFSLKFEQLERLCLALNCTPNDLFDWHPSGEQQAIAPNHSLNSLKPKEENLAALLREIPTEKFEQIESLLRDLKNQ
jgi:DNA-binding Xre family transcriptional regulator